jgi:hypothetical protein
MSNYPTFDALTFAAQSDLVAVEAEIENYLASGATYATQIAKGKDDLLGALLEHGVDPDTLVQGDSTAQLLELHVFYTLFRIYDDETRMEGDHFDLKAKKYKSRIAEEKEKRFKMRGVDQDLDADGAIDTDSVEEQYRDPSKHQPRIKRL